MAAERARDSDNNLRFLDAAETLCVLGNDFYGRGWALGTSGNYSIVLGREPLRLAITPSGADKGALTADQILEMDEDRNVLRGQGKPSAECLLHLAIVKRSRSSAVLHTHSIWATILSERYASQEALFIQGYEMLKGLAGVQTHEHRELVPILENSQDMAWLSKNVEEVLQANPQAHAFLLRGHGLYSWGETVQEAKRHIEVLEFLLEVVGRKEFGN